MRSRTERIQAELDGAAGRAATPRPRRRRSARPSATSRAERARLLAEADDQAEALLADGRARLEAEIAELDAKADADIAAAASRGGDELRGEIATSPRPPPSGSSSRRSTTRRNSAWSRTSSPASALAHGRTTGR